MNRGLVFMLLIFVWSATTAETIAIQAGHLIDPRTGKVDEDQTVIIDGSVIRWIGPRNAAPVSTRTVDLSTRWVMPGLIDAHTHLTLNTIAGDAPYEALYLKEATTYRGLRGLRNAQILLLAGFTSIRDVGNDADYAMQSVRRAIDDGWFDGPTVISSGKMIAPFGGQSMAIPPEQGPVWRFEYLDADTPVEVIKAVRQNIYYGAGVIKLIADNNAYMMSTEEMRAAVVEAHRAGVPVAVHVYGGNAAQSAIDAGVDSIEHGHDLTDVQLRLMKEKGIFLVGTDFPLSYMQAVGTAGGVFPEDSAAFSKKIIDRLKRAHRIGVKMAFGTDIFIDVPNRTRADLAFDYLSVWREAGIDSRDILRCMTSNAAELLRINASRGSIAVGYKADIVAMPQNPLSNIESLRQIDFVMKDGRIIRQP